jgi:aspartate-semialdehyde dehydrogenase
MGLSLGLTEMRIVVGRISQDPVLTVKCLCLGRNTIRGAAGAGLLSAELAAEKGYI